MRREVLLLCYHHGTQFKRDEVQRFSCLLDAQIMSSSFASQRNTKKFTYYKYFDVSVFINCSKSLGVEKLELPEKRSYNGIKILVASVKLQSLVSTSDPRVSTSPSCLSCWLPMYVYYQ